MTSPGRTEPQAAAPPVIFSPTIAVPPSQIQIIQARAEPSLLSFATYANAMPGVVVAVAGFIIVHKLTKMRDREKRAVDLCDELRKLAMESASTASEAWLSDPKSERVHLVHRTKQQIQNLGIAATRLKRICASVAPRYGLIACWQKRDIRVLGSRRPVDLSLAVAKFRKAATADPFEDPVRIADAAGAANVHVALGQMIHAIDQVLEIIS